jgi:hypothetical protein
VSIDSRGGVDLIAAMTAFAIVCSMLCTSILSSWRSSLIDCSVSALIFNIASSRLVCVNVDIDVVVVSLELFVFVADVSGCPVLKDNRLVACAYEIVIRLVLVGGVVEIESSSYIRRSAWTFSSNLFK